jgi:hypothetical protein
VSTQRSWGGADALFINGGCVRPEADLVGVEPHGPGAEGDASYGPQRVLRPVAVQALPGRTKLHTISGSRSGMACPRIDARLWQNGLARFSKVHLEEKPLPDVVAGEVLEHGRDVVARPVQPLRLLPRLRHPVSVSA